MKLSRFYLGSTVKLSGDCGSKLKKGALALTSCCVRRKVSGITIYIALQRFLQKLKGNPLDKHTPCNDVWPRQLQRSIVGNMLHCSVGETRFDKIRNGHIRRYIHIGRFVSSLRGFGYVQRRDRVYSH